jgi:hypothetical protein
MFSSNRLSVIELTTENSVVFLDSVEDPLRVEVLELIFWPLISSSSVVTSIVSLVIVIGVVVSCGLVIKILIIIRFFLKVFEIINEIIILFLEIIKREIFVDFSYDF